MTFRSLFAFAILSLTVSVAGAQTPAPTAVAVPTVALATGESLLPALPTPPEISRLQALSSTSFLLRWEMLSADPVLAANPPAISGFRIYRDQQVIADVPAMVREYRDSGLTPSTVYTYKVAALVGEQELKSRALSDVTRVPNMTTRETVSHYEVVVAGATPGGIAAALTAARLGHTVALVSPSPWLGGMMTGGLSRTDFGSMKSAGGLFKEFVDRVYRYYITTYGEDSPQAKASRTGYYFEPRVAKWVFHQMLAEQPNITVMLDHHTRDVVKEGNRVVAIYVLDRPRFIRKTIFGKVFIDATYEGDLAAQAGAAYRIGREDKTEFGEQHAGEIFWEPTKTKVQFGSGKGDHKVQAYNYRLCLTRRTDNLYPFPPPTNYDRNRYVTLLPDIASGRVRTMEQVLSILPLPNDKFDANNHPLGNPSSDLIGGADRYPEADLWQREPIAEAHRQHILGLLYFTQNDPVVPEKFREEARRWGFAYDEFVDNNHFPTQLYVREGRRIIGAYTFNENDARSIDPKVRPAVHYDSIGVADYPIDSHATSPEKNGLLEGFFYLPGSQTQPSQVPYRVMTPLGIEGVLVSVCVSCTHIGYGTLRMEPVFLGLGTAAGVAAHVALTENVVPSQVDIVDLQRNLLKQQHVISVFNDVPLDHPHWAALQYFSTRGFFPGYDARPDTTVTRAEAAQWLWQWLQEHKPGIKPMLIATKEFSDLHADHPAFLAVRSLRYWQVIPSAERFGTDDPLTAGAADAWIAAALAVVRGKKVPAVKPAALDSLLTRGDFCQKLYDQEEPAVR